MPLDERLIQFVAYVDTDIDLTVPHIIITALCGLTAFWVAQCLTRNAGFTCRRSLGLLLFRACLYLLSAGMMLNVAWAVNEEHAPWALDAVVRFFLLLVLLTIPFVLPRHMRSETLAEFTASSQKQARGS